METNLFEQMAKAANASYEVREISAIWMNTPVVIKFNGEYQRTVRLCSGMEVKIQDENIVDCDFPTHRITKCLGNLHSSILKFELTNIITQQTITLQVK